MKFFIVAFLHNSAFYFIIVSIKVVFLIINYGLPERIDKLNKLVHFKCQNYMILIKS